MITLEKTALNTISRVGRGWVGLSRVGVREGVG